MTHCHSHEDVYPNRSFPALHHAPSDPLELLDWSHHPPRYKEDLHVEALFWHLGERPLGAQRAESLSVFKQ